MPFPFMCHPFFVASAVALHALTISSTARADFRFHGQWEQNINRCPAGYFVLYPNPLQLTSNLTPVGLCHSTFLLLPSVFALPTTLPNPSMAPTRTRKTASRVKKEEAPPKDNVPKKAKKRRPLSTNTVTIRGLPNKAPAMYPAYDEVRSFPVSQTSHVHVLILCLVFLISVVPNRSLALSVSMTIPPLHPSESAPASPRTTLQDRGINL